MICSTTFEIRPKNEELSEQSLNESVRFNEQKIEQQEVNLEIESNGSCVCSENF